MTLRSGIQGGCDREPAKIAKRRERHLGIDDGIATGATIGAARRAIRMHKPDRLVPPCGGGRATPK
jgi:predicted phosphoribosyltransferase